MRTREKVRKTQTTNLQSPPDYCQLFPETMFGSTYPDIGDWCRYPFMDGYSAYYHHFIYLGNGEVASCSKAKNRTAIETAMDAAYKNTTIVQKGSQATAKRARLLVETNTKPYNLAWNNCEQFCQEVFQVNYPGQVSQVAALSTGATYTALNAYNHDQDVLQVMAQGTLTNSGDDGSSISSTNPLLSLLTRVFSMAFSVKF